mmetsp:Transcript_21178/g.61115  ORF Transcript_21178/g.61115 Transcript_21178/m.61115 type:complete len:214 (+) Transcript_21178:151-792(+)
MRAQAPPSDPALGKSDRTWRLRAGASGLCRRRATVEPAPSPVSECWPARETVMLRDRGVVPPTPLSRPPSPARGSRTRGAAPAFAAASALPLGSRAAQRVARARAEGRGPGQQGPGTGSGPAAQRGCCSRTRGRGPWEDPAPWVGWAARGPALGECAQTPPRASATRAVTCAARAARPGRFRRRPSAVRTRGMRPSGLQGTARRGLPGAHPTR